MPGTGATRPQAEPWGPPGEGASSTGADPPLRFGRSTEISARLRRLVPGGAHTYAKGEDQYPEGMAPIIVRGHGAHVWDADGNEFIEYGSGLRSVALGHAHPRVDAAVRATIGLGTNFVRPSLIEAEAAEAMLSIVPGADMVKFAKNGSDATTAAVRLARAVTGRDMVAICRDQPFFSVDDWFIGHSAMPAGVPSPTRALTVDFPFDDLACLEDLFDRAEGGIACVVLEAATATAPSPGYFEGLRSLCDERGALLVLDEMITGFRWSLAGAQGYYGINPDLATFGKALGNGYAVSALVGRREHMLRGGSDQDEEMVFLLSTTHGAETHGLAAAVAVIDVYRTEPVIETLWSRGERLAAGVREATTAAGVDEHVLLHGVPANLVFATLDADGERSQAYRTLFLQELISRGVLGQSFVVSAALTDADIDHTVEAVHGACEVYRRALGNGIRPYLRGRPVRPALRPFS